MDTSYPSIEEIDAMNQQFVADGKLIWLGAIIFFTFLIGWFVYKMARGRGWRVWTITFEHPTDRTYQFCKRLEERQEAELLEDATYENVVGAYGVTWQKTGNYTRPILVSILVGCFASYLWVAFLQLEHGPASLFFGFSIQAIATAVVAILGYGFADSANLREAEKIKSAVDASLEDDDPDPDGESLWDCVVHFGADSEEDNEDAMRALVGWLNLDPDERTGVYWYASENQAYAPDEEDEYDDE